MSDDRLTPEGRAVIEAALAWYDGTSYSSLTVAVQAYRKATAPPEPFDVFVGYDVDGNQIWVDDLSHTAYEAARVYRCTVTPVERVR